MSKNLLLTITIITGTFAVAQNSLASTPQSKKECIKVCEAKSEELNGQLVHQRYKKKISKEEYDKLSRSMHNEDLICIRDCKKGKSSKPEKSGKN